MSKIDLKAYGIAIMAIHFLCRLPGSFTYCYNNVYVVGGNTAKINQGGVTSLIDDKLILDGFILAQNYPNPFNPSTIISFSIPSSGFTSLKIYDVLGNEVATLVNEEKPAGNYEVRLNASSLTSGTYFYKLSAGSFTEVKKMILVK